MVIIKLVLLFLCLVLQMAREWLESEKLYHNTSYPSVLVQVAREVLEPEKLFPNTS
jgi:hypothetical protein